MSTKQILIVDDDRELARVLACRCTARGLRAQTAYDALSAIRFLLRDTPDLVCLDVNMPSGNGLNVCEMMAADEDTARIPVIILTGSSDPETIRRCHKLCAYYVLKCPDVWSRVEPLIAELIDVEPTQLQPCCSGG